MLDYDDENSPPASSKTFSSIKFRRSGVPTKGKSGLKVAISAPYALDRGGVPPSLGDPPLQTLNGTGALQPNSADPVLDGPPSSPQTLAQGFRRNSEIPLKQHRSRLAWPSNHPEITPNGGSPHPSTRGTRKKLRKADVSKLPALDSPRFSSISGIGRKRPPCSTRTNTGFRLSETAPTTVPEGCLGEAPAPQQPSFEKQAPGSDLLKTPSDEFDPRAVMGPLPALNFDLASAASFGSVKQRIRKIDKSLRTSRMMLLSAPAEKAKPELMYTDDSDAFSSPPSTPSTPIWETTPASSMQKIDPKLSSELELADVHAQIQAMIDSANRPFSVESADFLDRDREPSGTQRNDIPPSLRPGNIVHTSFPPRVIVHRRSASSPPLGSGIHHAYPPDFRDRPLFQPTTPVTPHGPASPASRPPEMGPTSPPSTSPADSMTPSTPHKKPSSEQSDSPSVYSQLSPSSRIYNVTPSSSYTSSPDHPYAKSKHERLLAAISEGISSPTKPGPTAPSILGSNPSRDDNTNLFIPPLVAQDPTVPVIVITNPNDDNLVYNESNSSIVDMYAGSADGSETVLRKRTRTANSHRPRNALDAPAMRISVSLDSPRLNQASRDRLSSPQELPKKRGSILRSGFPSSFLSMSTLHEVEATEANVPPKDRKSFYAAVGLKGLFRRSSSKGSLFGQAQSQANGNGNATGGRGGAQSGSTSLAVPNPVGGDDTLKAGWGLFKWKR